MEKTMKEVQEIKAVIAHNVTWGTSLSVSSIVNLLTRIIPTIIVGIIYVYFASKIGWIEEGLIYESKALIVILPVVYSMVAGALMSLIVGLGLVLKSLSYIVENDQVGKLLRVLILISAVVLIGVVIYLIGQYMVGGYSALNIMMIVIIFLQSRSAAVTSAEAISNE